MLVCKVQPVCGFLYRHAGVFQQQAGGFYFPAEQVIVRGLAKGLFKDPGQLRRRKVHLLGQLRNAQPAVNLAVQVFPYEGGRRLFRRPGTGGLGNRLQNFML